jgi:hypothetical protein
VFRPLEHVAEWALEVFGGDPDQRVAAEVEVRIGHSALLISVTIDPAMISNPTLVAADGFGYSGLGWGTCGAGL